MRMELLVYRLSRQWPAPQQPATSPAGARGSTSARSTTTTERVKRMVGRVLNGNGITELLQGCYRLIGSVAVRLLRRSGVERQRAR